MENIANEELETFVDFYNKLGVSSEQFFVGEKIVNIFDFLNIKPQVDDEGNRKLTPYEILGILPNIQNGVEKPIIFFIKTKFKGIKLVKPKFDFNFFYSKDSNKKDESIIGVVLRNYKSAIAQNNLEEADKQFAILDKLTGGRAKQYIGYLYDYTKFYRQMKKQLLVDIFSHFFLIYLMNKKSLIKKGLIVKNKKVKKYDSYKTKQINSIENIPEIKSIQIDNVDESLVSNISKRDEISEFDFDKEIRKIGGNKKKVVDEECVVEQQKIEPPKEKKSFIKKIKNRFFRDKKLKVEQLLKINEPEKKEENEINKNDKKMEKEVSYE